VGLLVGEYVVGKLVGDADGTNVGMLVGISEGVLVGKFVGDSDGEFVGELEGETLGPLEGTADGLTVGLLVPLQSSAIFTCASPCSSDPDLKQRYLYRGS
jgi:hypothetical protein